VLRKGTRPLDSQASPHRPLGPIATLDSLYRRLEAVDAIANEAKQTGLFRHSDPHFAEPLRWLLWLVRDPGCPTCGILARTNLWEKPHVP